MGHPYGIHAVSVAHISILRPLIFQSGYLVASAAFVHLVVNVGQLVPCGVFFIEQAGVNEPIPLFPAVQKEKAGQFSPPGHMHSTLFSTPAARLPTNLTQTSSQGSAVNHPKARARP